MDFIEGALSALDPTTMIGLIFAALLIGLVSGFLCGWVAFVDHTEKPKE